MPTPTPQELAATAARMRNILATRVDGDYEAQSVLGDLVVDAHTVVMADLSGQIAELRQRQSLRALRLAPVGVDSDEATDAILSNLFVDRDQGSFARGSAQVYFVQRVDTLIPRTTRFFKTTGLVFYVRTTTDLLVPAASMRPVYDGQGRVLYWAYPVPLIAARTGDAYNVDPGRFAAVDPFSPYISFVENLSKFAGGLGVETSATLVTRAETAMSVRSLVNDRSNDARIRAAFPETQSVLSLGAGDPEMVRDRVNTFGEGLPVHVLGHADIYVRLPRESVTETATVGDSAPRADGKALTFYDPSLAGGDFAAYGVRAGDVLVIASGLTDAPGQYRVTAVSGQYLSVEAGLPFSEATDEATSPPFITYSVGNDWPEFSNKVASASSASARTSRRISRAGCIILPGRPTYAISRVEVPVPPSALTDFVDPVTGTVLFTLRSNASPLAPVRGRPLAYRVRIENPEASQSTRAITVIEIGWPGETLAGTEVLVTYETLVGFEAVDELVSSRVERVTAANVLARAEHPVYVSCTIPYRPRTIPTNFGSRIAVVDESQAISAIVELIEKAPPGSLDVTALTQEATRKDSNFGGFYPFVIQYELDLPDGRVARYQTPDQVTLLLGGRSAAQVTNYAELGLSAGDTAGFNRLLTRLGVSDRVVRYLAATGGVGLDRRV